MYITVTYVQGIIVIYSAQWTVVLTETLIMPEPHYHVNDWWISLTQINACQMTMSTPMKKVEFRTDMK